MAIKVYGVGPDIDAAHWAKLIGIHGRGRGDEVVDSGLVVSVATGTRIVNISAGNAAASGVQVEVDAATTTTFAQNTSGNPRIDYVVLQVDWTGTLTTGGTIAVVQGTPKANPTAPALTRTPGTLWQIPLARVTVRSGVGQLLASDIEVCRPLKRGASGSSSAISSTTIGKNSSGVVVATVNVTDPGWDYVLWISANANVTKSDVGNCSLSVGVNGSNLQTVKSGNQNIADPVMPGRCTATLSGASTITATMVPLGMDASLSVTGGRLNVMVLPA